MSFGAGLPSGTIFAGDYRVIRQLSAGGMGAVYLVEQTSTGKERALKLMLPQLVFDPALRRRFEQEARVGALIASDHVVEVQAAGVDVESGMPYLVMELLKGADLGAHVARSGPLALGAMLTIFEQLCHAIGAAHRAGIVHRDLKPENVFLAQSMRTGASQVVKVLDFGIAKLAAEAEAKSKSTASIGSPMWMAPEQTERGPVTPAADVWALGLIAFFVLTGKPYWRTANEDGTLVAHLMREILFEPMPQASSRAAEVASADLLPSWFDVWFARCTAREPAARFADAATLFEELARLAEVPLAPGAVVGGATQPAFAQPLPTPFARAARTPPAIVSQPVAPRSRTYVVAAGSAILLVAGIGGAWAWSTNRDASLDVPDAAASAAPDVIPSMVAPPQTAMVTSAPTAKPTVTSAPTGTPPPTHPDGGPTVVLGALNVSGKLATNQVEDVLRLNLGRFRICYGKTIKTNPTASGTLTVSFVITATGSVPSATSVGSTVSDPELVKCVLGQFGRFFFPEPESGTVTVVFPLTFTPG